MLTAYKNRVKVGIKMKIKVSLCALLLAMNIGGNANAGGIPTFDGLALSQNLQEFMQYLQEYSGQVEAWAEEMERFDHLTTGINASTILSSIKLGGTFDEFFKGIEGLKSISPETFLENIAATGLNALPKKIRDAAKKSYAYVSLVKSPADVAKNALNDACAFYDGLNSMMATLDKSQNQRQKASIGSIEDMLKKELQGNSANNENASKSSGLNAAVDASVANLTQADNEYNLYRSKVENELQRAELNCNAAKARFAQVTGAAIGFASKLDALFFGSSSTKISFEVNTLILDPRYEKD